MGSGPTSQIFLCDVDFNWFCAVSVIPTVVCLPSEVIEPSGELLAEADE